MRCGGADKTKEGGRGKLLGCARGLLRIVGPFFFVFLFLLWVSVVFSPLPFARVDDGRRGKGSASLIIIIVIVIVIVVIVTIVTVAGPALDYVNCWAGGLLGRCY